VLKNERIKAEKEMQQKQHANDTAKNAKDKSDKEVNTLQKSHNKAKTSKKTTKKANTGASADGLEVLYNKLKEVRDAAKTNRQNATEAEKELNQASEKLQKITATVDTENKNLNQVNEKIKQKQIEGQQAKQEQGLTHQAVLDRTQKVERLKEEWLALTADHEIKQQALETARKTQGLRSAEDKIDELREKMNEVSGHLHRLSREEKQAKQRATHKQEEERIKLDDIVDYKNDTFQRYTPIKSHVMMRFLYKQGAGIKFGGSHAKVTLFDSDTQEERVFGAGPLSGKAHIHVSHENLFNIAKHLKLPKSLLLEQFNITVQSGKASPAASPEDPLTLNREIVLVQMGSDEAVVSTRKRIALDTSGKVYVVKEDDEGVQHSVEGNVKELTGEYEVNIIGRSTIQDSARVIEGRNAKELTDILTKIAPIEQGAGSVDTPILKKIKITHCKGSDCDTAVNNLASSLREEIGGDIPVEDSLEHQHNKTSEQLKAQQQKESDDQKKQQKENEVYKEKQREWRHSFVWKIDDTQQSAGFKSKMHKLEQAFKRDKEKEERKKKAELESVAEENRMNNAMAEVIQKSFDKEEEKERRKREESQEAKQKSAKFIMEDMETFLELPDDLSTRLKNYLMLYEVNASNIEPSKSKPKQTRSYKSKRSVKQVNIDNKERERLEAVVINTLRLHQTIISNIRIAVKFTNKLGHEWEKTVINMWLLRRKAQIEIQESTKRIHELSSVKGGVDNVLKNLTRLAFTKTILEIKAANEKDIKTVEHNHNFISVAEQDLKNVLESMGILETTMQAESSLEMVEIQRILMLQKDFDPMGIRQKNFKLAQEQEKKATAAFHKRAHHLEEIIEFITKMKAPLEMIYDAEKFKESVVQLSIEHPPFSPILHKIQKVQKVSAEEIRSSEDKGITHKQEKPSISNKRLNEEGLIRHDLLLDDLIKEIKQMHTVFRSQNTLRYNVLSSDRLYDEIGIAYHNLIKRHQGILRKLEEETNTLSKIFDEDERKQEILHINKKFKNEIGDFTKKISAMSKEMDRYKVMLHNQIRNINKTKR
jgi:hypothetical protein